MYGITDRLSVMAMVNYQTASMSMDMFSTSSHQHAGADHASASGHMDMVTSGLADSKIYVSYGLSQTVNHSLVLSSGVNIPTGSITHTGDAGSMYPGTRLPYMMQTGSGTWDIIPGITYNRFFRKWNWSAQATGVYRPFYNTVGYHYGNEVVLTSWATHHVGKTIGLSVRGEAIYQGDISGKDRLLFKGMEPSADSRNYGGKSINGYIGCTYAPSTGKFARHSLAVEAGFPFVQQLNGIQLSRQQTITAAWLYSF
jgi:hypothetical protein